MTRAAVTTLSGMTRADNDKPVVLSKIYTKTGDDGTTALGDMSRTRKTDPRLAAYADVEEANAAIGVALATGGLSEEVTAVLTRVQNELFDVGADLCCPVVENPEFPPLRVEESYIAWLEEQCDRFNAELKPLRSFILPGGAPPVAFLHLARTVVRRAERSAWAALEAHDDVNPLTAKYLNRLSDLMFILCRVASAGDEILWKPGGTR
ncbi:cob(I)yrinic acid a,c-diamide adenosyltransferase [Microbispora rosea subsp. aerata]|nr:cob(I)yrinic acid a,c-diamide adenosyltransferase [Microbispora rosea subsp. aerata]GIH57507.1 cob(I)yrinic acid a,c-diamide adenosyltransferase [Microbispora rosea subsp. aerata]GLJ85477.1 cob(I)yrinic acid a,c-diamide adenosyltransferase [Microbispora rosea subsp. aerata]